MRAFWKSVKHALRGLREIAKREQSFRIQLVVATFVVILLIMIPLATWERVLLIVMVAAVLVLEIINSIFERISDALKPRLHPMVRDVKDMMAGAVLVTAVTSIVVAILIFWSYLSEIIMGRFS